MTNQVSRIVPNQSLIAARAALSATRGPGGYGARRDHSRCHVLLARGGLFAMALLAAGCQSSSPGGGSGAAQTGGSSSAGGVYASGGAGSGGASSGGASSGGAGSGGSGGRTGGVSAGGATMPGGAGGTATAGGTGGGVAGAPGRTGGSSGGTGTSAGGGGSIGNGGSGGNGGSIGNGGLDGGNPGDAASAAGHYYVSPTGTGDACTVAAPCSIAQAQTVVRSAASGMQSDLVVELVDGTYRLTAPLIFTDADSGANGHTISWQAATGAHPVLSGGKQITGWAVSDSGKNIWKATAPGTFATRQLYVDGTIAARSSHSISRNGMSHDNATFPLDSGVSFLNNAAQANRIEVHALGNWTDHYAPVQSIANSTVTMVQPSWFNQTFGWDTITSPFAGPTKTNNAVYIENAYALLSSPGQWYQDIAAGVLYYIPLSGQDMTKVTSSFLRLRHSSSWRARLMTKRRRT